MVKILAPATSANLGPGFDTFALALESPADVMEFRERKEGIVIKARGYGVPLEPEENIAGIVARDFLKKYGIHSGVEIRMEKNIRPKSGLGSSAASAAGAAYGLSSLFNVRVTNLELLELALEGEKASSGAGHADNLAACIYGGFTIAGYKPLRVFSTRVSDNIRYAVLLPEVAVSTRQARDILPSKVPLDKMTHNLGYASFLLAGLLKNDTGLIALGMRDELVEPLRKGLIPFYDEVKKAALEAGALGATISGSGPALIALCDSTKVSPRKVAEKMLAVYGKKGLKADIYTGAIGEGCRLA